MIPQFAISSSIWNSSGRNPFPEPFESTHILHGCSFVPFPDTDLLPNAALPGIVYMLLSFSFLLLFHTAIINKTINYHQLYSAVTSCATVFLQLRSTWHISSYYLPLYLRQSPTFLSGGCPNTTPPTHSPLSLGSPAEVFFCRIVLSHHKVHFHHLFRRLPHSPWKK